MFGFLCRLHGSRYKKVQKKIEELETFDSCWNVKENEPVLVSISRICNDPLESIKYVDSLPSSEESMEKREKKLNSLPRDKSSNF